MVDSYPPVPACQPELEHQFRVNTFLRVNTRLAQGKNQEKVFTLLFFSLKHLFVISASALSSDSSLHVRHVLSPFSTLQASFVRGHFRDGFH